MNQTPMNWPEGKRFAFTVFDDTDCGTRENLSGVYRLLADLGMRTTKSVWVMPPPPEGGVTGGVDCTDLEYLEWVRQLQRDGFEIGYHMARDGSSPRAMTIEALERFKELFGRYPATMANHARCKENIYWGPARLTGAFRLLYNMATFGRRKGFFRGHVQEDPHFWGDICAQRIKYARNFVFNDINTLKRCPEMPYFDPGRPYVPYWYAGSDGANVVSFNRCIGEAAQDRLEEEGGACIMYAHFGRGFGQPGGVDATFRRLMERLAKKNGWFVPAGTLLDYLLAQKEQPRISSGRRMLLEARWLSEKLLKGTT